MGRILTRGCSHPIGRYIRPTREPQPDATCQTSVEKFPNNVLQCCNYHFDVITILILFKSLCGGIDGQQPTANWPKPEFFWQMGGWPFFALLPAAAHRGSGHQTSNEKVFLSKQQRMKVAPPPRCKLVRKCCLSDNLKT